VALPGRGVVEALSSGGAALAGPAAGNPNVVGLVYLSAFAPEPGEPVAALLGDYPVDLDTATAPDAAGFVFVDREKFPAVFAADLPLRQARAMAAAQKPIHGSVFAEATPIAAWKAIPSWYLVAQQDHALNPDLERLYAKRINARTREIPSSHVSFLSHPREVADLIEEAAVEARVGTTA
jgi:pimeloyl-ACP methyl ester carboxylesterase